MLIKIVVKDHHPSLAVMLKLCHMFEVFSYRIVQECPDVIEPLEKGGVVVHVQISLAIILSK